MVQLCLNPSKGVFQMSCGCKVYIHHVSRTIKWLEAHVCACQDVDKFSTINPKALAYKASGYAEMCQGLNFTVSVDVMILLLERNKRRQNICRYLLAFSMSVVTLKHIIIHSCTKLNYIMSHINEKSLMRSSRDDKCYVELQCKYMQQLA